MEVFVIECANFLLAPERGNELTNSSLVDPAQQRKVLTAVLKLPSIAERQRGR